MAGCIGEAAKNLTAAFRQSHGEVSWRELAGMRDKLIHGYFGVDFSIVWDVVKNEMPDLKQQVESILRGMDEDVGGPI